MGLGTLTDYFLLKSFVMILRKDAIYLEATSKNWILIFKAFIFVGLAENSWRAEFETLLID